MVNKEKVLEIMKSKGIANIRELSKKSMIPYTTLYYIFKGHDTNISTIRLLADFLKEPVENLIDREDTYVLYKCEGDKTYKSVIRASNPYEIVYKYMM